MNERQRRRFERGSRVEAFMTSNVADFPAGGKGAVAAAQLSAEMAALAALDVAKATTASTRRQSSEGRRELRESLRAQVAAVCDTAEAVGAEHPEARGRFPRTRADNSDQTLVAVARSFAEAAASLKALFVEYELPADFVERLRADADALEAQMSRQTEGRGASVSTNASIETALGRVEELTERLDVLVRNKYRRTPAKLAAWESARRLEHAPRARRDGEAPPAPGAPQP
ncbi:MAG TPA: hypothetical protein VF588_11640 [Pyrinomonadaceae bacterium]|jgi:hypothetical protein